MQFDFSQLSSGQAYACLTQTITPRPIAWVLSENLSGNYNLAPFSYFNAVCSEPPLLMLSIGHKNDGTLKDTRRNILEREHFVVHIAHLELLDALNASAASLPFGESEVARLGLSTTEFVGSPLPRLTEARAAFYCTLYQAQELGPQKQALLLGEVRQLYVDDGLVVADPNGRPIIDSAKLDPLARLGGNNYASLGEHYSLPRPD